MNCFSILAFVWWLLFSICKAQQNTAEDCAVYKGEAFMTSLPPVKSMYHQLSTGVRPDGHQFVAKLSLTSLPSGDICEVMIHGDKIAVTCPHRKSIDEWSTEIFQKRDVTEIWIHLGSLYSEDKNNTDLVIVGRRGSHRGHLLFRSSGLQPPLLVHWTPFQKMDYYYNCVTGCLYTRKVETSPGTHSFFLRPGRNFNYLHVRYNSTEYRTSHEVFLNASDILPDGNWKNLTVVWNIQAGDVGVLVDNVPQRGLLKYSELSKSRVVAEIHGEGHLTLCDQRFKEVADARNEEEYFRGTTLAPAPSSVNNGGFDISQNWLMIIALVCIALLLLMAIILVILLLRTKKALQRERDSTAREAIAVDTFGCSQTATVRSTAPLYPSTSSHDIQVLTTSPKGSNGGSKGPAPPILGSTASNPQSHNGSRTQEQP